MKIWLDDVRVAPEGWTWVKSASNCITLMQLFPEKVEEISLDHDLGLLEETGYDVLTWLEEQVATKVGFWHKSLPKINIHTANPVARKRMEAAREKIYELTWPDRFA